ncbi:MAG: hypothetical protein DRQ49_08940 [Gammaproteobacteria bacterium]|nr:MAG: hypothetical protein DRQ49_08940 [Gammaproteobacteria bacterium]RKZ42063.1 MAG: hypothetical protein DRQ41_07430 [Gammaproteobacteria bacterium]RKZ75593.1 MAG: hypothetical protein DRQ57_06865 [Gammaproteobacteria bacterium]
MFETQKLWIGLLLVVLLGPTYAQDRALLVGIDEYQYVSQLRGSKQDVEDMQQFIQSVWGYQSQQIRVLTDASATRRAILNAFDDWLIKGSHPGDRVLFYYSGHGYYQPDDNGDEGDGFDETLCPVETSDAYSMIRDDEINARLQQLKGRQVTVIIDACHSGTVTRSLTVPKADPTIKMPVFKTPFRGLSRSLARRQIEQDGFTATQQNVIAYSAVAPNQVALVDIENPYRGVFTHRFIEGVRDKRADHNQDGKVSHAELLDYLRHESQAYCDRNSRQCKMKELSPQLEAKPDLLAADVRTGIIAKTTNTVTEVTNVLAHDNEAQLQIEMLPGKEFILGQSMKIRVNSDHNGYLLLFDVNSTGHLTRLFPNQYSEQLGKEGYVSAGQSLTIPDSLYGFDFIAEEPIGKGLLIALLVEDKLSSIQALIPTAFEQIHSKQAQAVLQQLRQQLNQTLQQDNAANRPIRWSITVIEYEIMGGKRGLRG